MTSLNIGQVTPTKRETPAHQAPCPKCRAGKDRRVNAGGFGPCAVVLCENCGYEFKEQV